MTHSGPQTGLLPFFPLPCHALLMSLSLTQLLVQGLEVINLMKEHQQPSQCLFTLQLLLSPRLCLSTSLSVSHIPNITLTRHRPGPHPSHSDACSPVSHSGLSRSPWIFYMPLTCHLKVAKGRKTWLVQVWNRHWHMMMERVPLPKVAFSCYYTCSTLWSSTFNG